MSSHGFQRLSHNCQIEANRATMEMIRIKIPVPPLPKGGNSRFPLRKKEGRGICCDIQNNRATINITHRVLRQFLQPVEKGYSRYALSGQSSSITPLRLLEFCGFCAIEMCIESTRNICLVSSHMTYGTSSGLLPGNASHPGHGRYWQGPRAIQEGRLDRSHLISIGVQSFTIFIPLAFASHLYTR